MFLDSACSCPHTVYWSQVFSGEWRCRWSSADRRCSNYIWVINDFITYSSAPYIRDLMVIQLQIYFALTLFVMMKETQNFSHSMTAKLYGIYMRFEFCAKNLVRWAIHGISDDAKYPHCIFCEECLEFPSCVLIEALSIYSKSSHLVKCDVYIGSQLNCNHIEWISDCVLYEEACIDFLKF